MRVRAWITIHLCSKLLLGVSRMYRKISLKNTWKWGTETSLVSRHPVIQKFVNFHKKAWAFYLNLHFQVLFEVGEKSEKYSEWQFKHLWNWRNTWKVQESKSDHFCRNPTTRGNKSGILREKGLTIFRQCDTQVLLDSIDEHVVGPEDRSCVLQDWQE